MRILFLTFYYPPDLSAGSFRARALVNALLEHREPQAQIEVLTTVPNRYSSFSRADTLEEEEYGNLRIRRIRLPAHRSGMIDQSTAFSRFAMEALRYVATREYELVLATSSRLMTATLAAWIARRKRARLYLDIRDIFVDTIGDILPEWSTMAVKPVASRLERWTLARAHTVNLVSRGFETYFRGRYPALRYSFFTNGVDQEFIDAATGPGTPTSPHNPVLVVYAGNIGEGQGLHVIVPELAKRLQSRARFLLIGDGGRRDELIEALRREQIDNVELQAPMERDQLIQAYRAADVLFVHLNAYKAFERVLPSKLFEYGAMGKPIWAGLAGYAADFARSEMSNTAVFDPCNVDRAVEAFSELALTDTPRPDFIRKFAREEIMQRMAADVFAIGQEAA